MIKTRENLFETNYGKGIRLGIAEGRRQALKEVEEIIDKTFKDIKTDINGFSSGINMRIIGELKSKIKEIKC